MTTMRRRRSHPTILILQARTTLKKVAGKDCFKKLPKGLQQQCRVLLLVVMLVFSYFCSGEQKPVGKIIKFGTNIDLSDPKR